MAGPGITGSGGAGGASGGVPGTQRSGLILYETVSIERKSGGVWSSVATGVPATFEVVRIHTRYEMQTWTHKPLLCVWLLPDTSVQDGDRVIRSDGSHWYVRGAPLTAPAGTHIVALTERGTEDGLFAAYSAAEPS